MSGLFDGLVIPTVEDVIKKYEVAPKNNAGNSLMTKAKGPARRLYSSDIYYYFKELLPFFYIVGGVSGFVGTVVLITQYSRNSVEHVASVVQKYVDIDNSGDIDSKEEEILANEMLSGIAKSNNAKYYPGKARAYDNGLYEGLIGYHKGFYCGDRLCGIDKVKEWVKAYDQNHRGERK